MKKGLAVVVLLICALTAFSDEKCVTVGISPEWNIVVKRSSEGGTTLRFDCHLPFNAAQWDALKKGAVSETGADLSIMEPIILKVFFPESDCPAFYIVFNYESTETKINRMVIISTPALTN